jgi:trehalose/maltose hydrolase-like predicted phosphorylase
MHHALDPTPDPTWTLDEAGYDPLREESLESRFSISNGFLGVRGSHAITRGERWIAPPRTYVAGLFDTPGPEGSVPGLVPAADWLRLRLAAPGGPLACEPGDVKSHRMTLDLKRGLLLTDCHEMDGPGVALRLRTSRLVSLSDRAIGLQLLQLDVERGEMELTLEASFEGLHLGLVTERLEQALGVWRTKRSGRRLAIAAAASLEIDGRDLAPIDAEPLLWRWRWTSRAGQTACFARLVAMARSDAAGLDPAAHAQDRLRAAQQRGWRGVQADHEAAWAIRWAASDVVVEGDAPAQRALRFAIYQLNSAANPADERVSIAARALTGDDYRGHVFWDTEIFLLPFYALTWPEAARALLMYRFHTLDAARAKAARMGWRGALYAWESADTGAEATPSRIVAPDRRVVEVVSGAQEQHISADVAYAVWQYWLASGDEAFLLDAGAEILLETARFWASRAQPGPDGRHHIRGVMGPDEYHPNVDDNAFTNVMARWNIRQALEVAALLRHRWPNRWSELSTRLDLDEAELAQWDGVAEALATGFDPKTGLFEQFTGFFGFEHVDLTAYAGRSVPMDVVLGRERAVRSQVVKQADVVALLALLPEAFPDGAAETNFRYYEPRCGHGSSLSGAMHGLAAARLGAADLALRFFRQTANIDLADTHAATAGGVHIGAQGGLWLTTVFGFAGLSLLSDGLALDPRPPAGWRSLGFAVQWRGRRLRIRIRPGDIEATLEDGAPMNLVVHGEAHELGGGQVLRIALPGRGEVRAEAQLTPSGAS